MAGWRSSPVVLSAVVGVAGGGDIVAEHEIADLYVAGVRVVGIGDDGGLGGMAYADLACATASKVVETCGYSVGVRVSGPEEAWKTTNLGNEPANVGTVKKGEVMDCGACV